MTFASAYLISSRLSRASGIPRALECILRQAGRLKDSVMYLDGKTLGKGYANFPQRIGYEVSPFNIKMTIVQPNMEINDITKQNYRTSTLRLPLYALKNNQAPLYRTILGGLFD